MMLTEACTRSANVPQIGHISANEVVICESVAATKWRNEGIFVDWPGDSDIIICEDVGINDQLISKDAFISSIIISKF